MTELFSGWEFVAACGAVFGAAVVRGFAGFGFSALTVTMLTVIAPPTVVVPMVFMMEIAASASMLPTLWRKIDFRWVSAVAVGLAVGSPLGLFLLTKLPVNESRFAIYGVLAVISAAALLQHRGNLPQLKAPAAFVGLLAGVGNGMAAIAGAVCVLFLLADKNAEPAKMRASLVGLFILTDIYALCWGGALGIAGASQLHNAALLLPALFLGLAAGARLFARSNPARYRAVALGVIFAAAALALARQAAALWF